MFIDKISIMRMKWRHNVCCIQHTLCSVFSSVAISISFLKPEIIGMWNKWKGSEVMASQGTVSVLFGGSGGENWRKPQIAAVARDTADTQASHLPYAAKSATCALFSPLPNISYRARACWISGFAIILRHSTLGRVPTDEWSARLRGLFHTAHNIKTSTPLAMFEPAIPASERPQTHALDRAAPGIGTRAL
jgi:hypothetical protein